MSRIQAVQIAVMVGLLAAPLRAGYPRRNAVVEAVEKARPSVVNINTERLVQARPWGAWDIFLRTQRVPSLGTGVVVNELGYIVTNWHVVDGVTSIRVTTLRKETFPAYLVVRDPDIDLAILKIEPGRTLSAIDLGTSGDLMIGETVIAVGNAFGYQHTVTVGVISARERSIRTHGDLVYKDLIQTDASINFGNSGGPLLNINGKMIGMNTAVRAEAKGIGFALPVDTVKQSLAHLLNISRLRHAWHGMTLRDLKAREGSTPGVFVQRVEQQSPADKARIVPGEIITHVDVRPVHGALDVEAALLDKKSGDPVTLKVRGLSGVRDVVVRLAPAPVPSSVREARRRLGLDLEALSAAGRRRTPTNFRGGLYIRRVTPGGPGAQIGVKEGDVLVGLHVYETKDLHALGEILRNLPANAAASIWVLRRSELLPGTIVVK